MRNVRNLLIAVCVLGGTAAVAAAPGIEVLRCWGIEVLYVETQTTCAPPGCMVHAVFDLGAGPIIASIAPVNPVTGKATVTFPQNHPNARVELRSITGVLLDFDPLTQFE